MWESRSTNMRSSSASTTVWSSVMVSSIPSRCAIVRPLQELGRLICMFGILQYLLSGQALPQEKAEDDGCRPVHDDRPPRWRRQQIRNCK
jgi:hypothetical protein